MDPADLAALVEQARTLHRAQRWDEAEQAYRLALQAAPHDASLLRDWAWLLFARGQRDAGIEQMRLAAAAAPAAPVLQFDLGNMHAEMGHTEPSVRCFEAAIRLDPNYAAAHFNLGNAHWRLGRQDMALACYATVVRLSPDDPAAQFNLAVALKETGRLDEASAGFEKVVALQADHARAWTNLGLIAGAQGRFEDAVQCLQKVVAIEPQSPAAHFNLASAWRACNRLPETIVELDRTLALDPQHAAAHHSLGSAHHSQGDVQGAVDGFRAALRITGDDALRIKCALTLPVILESNEQIDKVRQQLAADLSALAVADLHVANPVQAIGVPAFPLAYHGRDDRALQTQIAQVIRRASPQVAFVAPHCQHPHRRPGSRIKLGFVSANFRDHTISKLNAGVIEQLDRSQFEVLVFRLGVGNESMTQFIRQHADRMLDLPYFLEQAQQQIAAQELDVLLFTDIGFDALTYHLAHARLAPLQCVTWGHPLTTGIPTLDCFISSEALDLPEAAAHYTERLVRLPHMVPYYFRPDFPPSTKERADFGLPGAERLYGCLQVMFKIHPDDDAVFAEILRRDPGGALVLLQGNFPNWTMLLEARFRRTIPDVADRIHFARFQPPADFAHMLSLFDALLDPLHFGGGDTSYQSFATGSPIITLPGPFLRSRITYALYQAMGLSECVARDAHDYVERALRLATDRQWHAERRAEILAANHAIFENVAGVREMEQFLARATAGV